MQDKHEVGRKGERERRELQGRRGTKEKKMGGREGGRKR